MGREQLLLCLSASFYVDRTSAATISLSFPFHFFPGQETLFDTLVWKKKLNLTFFSRATLSIRSLHNLFLLGQWFSKCSIRIRWRLGRICYINESQVAFLYLALCCLLLHTSLGPVSSKSHQHQIQILHLSLFFVKHRPYKQIFSHRDTACFA